MTSITELRVGAFLIEVGIVFLFTVLSMYLLAWRIKRYTGTDLFANRNYLYVGLALSIVIAIGRTVWDNEEKLGRAVF